MPKRTTPIDAKLVEVADDLDDLVVDKREAWRASAAKARRRQRRYEKRFAREVTQLARKGHWNDDDEL